MQFSPYFFSKYVCIKITDRATESDHSEKVKLNGNSSPNRKLIKPEIGKQQNSRDIGLSGSMCLINSMTDVQKYTPLTPQDDTNLIKKPRKIQDIPRYVFSD